MDTTHKPLILIEFNELSPPLMHRFINSGKLPNFQRFYSESHVYTTDAEEEGDLLNPWVQWVTVHTGLSAAEHGVTWLSEGAQLTTKALWDYVSHAGFKVWICGSMNSRYDVPLNGYLLPDPWSTNVAPYPSLELDSYYKFVCEAVQEHTNRSHTVSKTWMLHFIWFMVCHGLSLGTTCRIISQLLSEKRGRNCWRRATILDHLQFDLFKNIYKKFNPDFSTFFLNSTAHYQHTYWRHMAPESFQVLPTEHDINEYGNAIEYGYREMDGFLGNIMNLIAPNTTLIFCTAMSQQPYRNAEATGGRHYYRLREPRALCAQMGLRNIANFTPVMADQILIRFTDEASCCQAARLLKTYRFENRQVFHLQPSGKDLMIQCSYSSPVSEDALIVREGSSQVLKFFDVFYPMDVIKSGVHHPDGMLWVRYPDRKHQVCEKKISIRAIAPAILEHFGISCPDFITCEPFTAVTGSY